MVKHTSATEKAVLVFRFNISFQQKLRIAMETRRNIV